MSERLKKHGLRWRLRGLPIYGRGLDVDGYDENEIVGYTAEDEWKWSDLTADEQAWVEGEAADLLAQSTERTPDNPISADLAFGWVLGEYGVACPHRWSYTDDPRGVPFLRDCRVCYVSEPLPGVVVQVGEGWLRLNEPLPRILRVPVAASPSDWINAGPSAGATSPDLKVDEYEWTGHQYRKVASR